MNKVLHRFCLLLTGATLFLIFAGGLVTSTQSGLAVPDWPLSYGRLMPPMVGGVFYEHGHRMIAAAVGLLTVILALLAGKLDTRRWVRRAAWGAVGLVVVQGVLGGLTVLFRLPKPISIAHACMAQTFFSLVVCLAVWTSSYWQRDPQPRQEEKSHVPLHRLCLVLFAVTYAQLLFGATLRHTGRVLPLHVAGAVGVLAFATFIFGRVWKTERQNKALCRLASALAGTVIAQVLLGLTTLLLVSHKFYVIPIPFWATALITSHVVVGAATLGLAVATGLVAYRSRPLGSSPLKTTLSDYLTLTKPGISFMAGITALASFILGSREGVSVMQLFHTCLGTLMAAGGAGSLNMLIEQDIDARMKRTQSRPLPSGRLNGGEVLALGTFLSLAGSAYLAWKVNILTAGVAALTISIYIYVYTPLKKISISCVWVGAIAGALPPVMGWTAATGRLGLEPLVLFGIVFFWQFPHFLSLAWLYKEDYAEGGLHMVEREDRMTARSMLISSIALFIVSVLPNVLQMTGWVYLATAVFSSGWMLLSSTSFYRDMSRANARHVFLLSLAYVPLLVLAMVLNAPGRPFSF